jgi:hypothetical protein
MFGGISATPHPCDACLSQVSRKPPWTAAACCRFDARSLLRHARGGARRPAHLRSSNASSAQLAEEALHGRAARVPASRLDGLKRQQAAAVQGPGLRPGHCRPLWHRRSLENHPKHPLSYCHSGRLLHLHHLPSKRPTTATSCSSPRLLRSKGPAKITSLPRSLGISNPARH